MGEPTCKMCGSCCHYYINGKVKKCKFLVKLKNGKTLCRVYFARLGTLIEEDKKNKITIRCCMRKDAQWDYPGCPYNNGKPMWTGKDEKNRTQIPRNK